MSLELIVVTPQGQAFADSVEWVVLPGLEGDLGVLEQHERFLTTLRFGEMEVRNTNGRQWRAVTEGFAEVDAEQVVVLADHYQRVDQIDRTEVTRERDRLREALQDLSGSREDEARRPAIEAALARADLRLKALDR